MMKDNTKQKQEFIKEYLELCKKYQMEIMPSGHFEGYLFLSELDNKDDIVFVPKMDDNNHSVWD